MKHVFNLTVPVGEMGRRVAPTVLHIEDDAGLRFAVSCIFDRAGFRVRMAQTGNEGLRLAAEQPDLILLDTSLPDMGGWDVCRRLKADPATASIPVLHLTPGAASPAEIAAGLESGADGYLAQPVDPDVLVSTARALLRKHRAEQRVTTRLEEERAAHAETSGLAADLARVLNALPQVVWTSYPDGTLEQFNERWYELTGQTLDEATATAGSGAIHPDDRASAEARWCRALATGEPTSGEIRIRTRDGVYRWHLSRSVPMRGAGGLIDRWVGTLIDIDDAKCAQAERERLLAEISAERKLLETVVNQLPVGVIVVEAGTGKLILGNEEMRRLWPNFEVGRTLWSYAGKYYAERKDGTPVSAAEWPLVRALQHGEIVPGEEIMCAWDGHEPVVMEQRAAPVVDDEGRIVAAVATTVDVTVWKRSAIERARLVRELQESLRTRDEFLSIAAHDLKTPLTAMKLNLWALQMMVRDSPEPPPHDVLLASAEKAGRQVDRMADLLEHLLDVSRLSAGPVSLDLKKVDLVRTVRAVLRRTRDLAKKAGCEVIYHGPRRVVGNWDPTRIEQVITNLLTNALKYAPKAPVEILVEHDRDHARLLVRDHGPGIKSCDLARIFERFERLSLRREVGSFGVGLWIVHRVAEALDGNVRVESTPGQGTTFTVELPKRGPSTAL